MAASSSSARSWSRGPAVATISPSDSMVSALPRQSLIRPPRGFDYRYQGHDVERLQVRPVQAEPDEAARERRETEAAPVEHVPSRARADRLHPRGGAGVEGVRVGDAGDDGTELGRPCASDRPAVEQRFPTGDADADRLVEQVGDDPDDGPPFVAERDQGAEARKSGGELPRPVDRVEDPDPVPTRAIGAELLAEDAVRRLALLDDSAQRRLHRSVHRRDRRSVGLDVDLRVARDALCGLARRVREHLGQPDEFVENHAGSATSETNAQ